MEDLEEEVVHHVLATLHHPDQEQSVKEIMVVL
jgi:hypothetical protein